MVGWGRNAEGQAIPPSDLTGVVAIAAGYKHSLALKSDGKVVAWGQINGLPGPVPSDLDPGNTVTVTLQVSPEPPASTPDGQVEASGTIPVPGGNATFTLTAKKTGARVLGSLTYTDPVRTCTLTSTALTAVVVTGRKARVFGNPHRLCGRPGRRSRAGPRQGHVPTGDQRTPGLRRGAEPRNVTVRP